MKLWGLTIRVNPLFLLILIIFYLLGMFLEITLAFILVFIHEIVHMLVAWKNGYKVGKIEIFPFGGMAEYNGMLEMEPWQEIKVALAGPIFNLLFALLLYIMLKTNTLQSNIYMNVLLEYNLVIAIINLLPALPLDGGRVWRAVMILKYGLKKGNEIALRTARFISYTGIVIGIIIIILNQSNIWFLFFFFFIYGMINREEKQIFYYILRYLSKKNNKVGFNNVKELSGHVVSDKLPVKDAIFHINPVNYNLYFVLSKDYQIEGIISESSLISSYFNHRDKEIIMWDIIYTNR
ncbi:MAG: M50 family metallopeptidase [Halanaerobiaceae bacterium]